LRFPPVNVLDTVDPVDTLGVGVIDADTLFPDESFDDENKPVKDENQLIIIY
jgi:hypothetical protein